MKRLLQKKPPMPRLWEVQQHAHQNGITMREALEDYQTRLGPWTRSVIGIYKRKSPLLEALKRAGHVVMGGRE